jgi:hypothetical protein
MSDIFRKLPADKKDVVKTLNKDKEYPVDILRKLYINTDETLEQIAREFSMPLDQLELMAKSEEKSWHQLKEETKHDRLEYFRAIAEDNGIETISVVEELHLVTIVDMRSKINFLKKYYKEHGDLYARNSEKEILLDGRGQPISLSIPNSVKDLLSLQGILKLKDESRESVKKLMASDPAPRKISNNQENVIDVSQYGIFKDDEE